jgi:hypothetical protein
MKRWAVGRLVVVLGSVLILACSFEDETLYPSNAVGSCLAVAALGATPH